MPKKRGNHEGTTVHRKDGRWMASITIGRDPTTGKLKRVSFYGKTRQEGADQLADALNELDVPTKILASSSVRLGSPKGRNTPKSRRTACENLGKTAMLSGLVSRWAKCFSSRKRAADAIWWIREAIFSRGTSVRALPGLGTSMNSMATYR